MSFRASTEAIRFALEEIGGLGPDMAAGRAGELTPEMLAGILAEAARFAESEFAPRNVEGDRIGARFADGRVTMPPGWPALYRAWAEAGWNGVDLPAAFGGMGLPTRVAMAVMEIFTSACMGFFLLPVLTQGAVDALMDHASDDLRALYVPRLVAGEWVATMNLTEPQAGSDLGQLSTKATPAGDGSFRIQGAKIFITFGAHDLAENIIHLVLARLEGAPAGTRGISLFLVPQVLPSGEANDVICTGIEHKLGIHASPTCSMRFGEKGGAIGWLVGEANKGLACMFTMMNKARLYTGLQGVAIAERAYQAALSFARERRQGRAPGGEGAGADPIILHPDVRRMLLAMRAKIAAGRALACKAAHAIDHAEHDPAAAERAGLLTPIVKAACSEIGCAVTSLAVQVHGGMGYVEETGVAQHFRDARITPIYEGTNGIQAIDLVTRKVLRPGSTLAGTMIGEFQALADAARAAGMAAIGETLREGAVALEGATEWLRQAINDSDRLLGAATPYLQLFAVVAGHAALIEGALAARRRLVAGESGAHLHAAILDAEIFAANEGVLAPSLARIVRESRVPRLDLDG